MSSIRILRRLTMAVTLLTVAVLSLSDGILGPMRAGASTAVDVGRAVETETGVELGSRFSPPVEADTIGHLVLWTGVGLVAAGLATRPGARLRLALGLFALSAAVEVGQRYLSSTRSAEITDLAANGVGLTVGFLAYAAVEALTRLWWVRLRGLLGPRGLPGH
jgi:hypothetical protein